MPAPDVSLIATDDLKFELRITHSLEDERLDKLGLRATALVLDYLEAEGMVTDSPATWDWETVPHHVAAAILQVACNLYRNPGDDGAAPGPISDRVRNILERERTPVVR